ncbi:hypothetical protein MW290_12010 [Aquincola tertiaricarbonis]|uniref:Uncharacterized protein n=1 Tax=Aquincola tertiaricarbonis TaxID=391953 RepID=A0ABY4S6B4_AQUTE|nr:hypothetical protein [Aquincola tertiaricarbonis]URI06621.1 hypothetical protein MW290_12010 [Aquincola tertiaricarbonis]
MGFPSGYFVSSRSGRLQVTFSGKWSVSNSDPVANNGTWQLALRCLVGEGSDRLTATMNLTNNTAVLERDYPGGNVPVFVGIELLGYTLGGAGSISARKLRVRCRLYKK